ncbi:MAG: hypothetical protein E6Q97_26140 [Desulfurellales bacterium]|nr:MAG: hypothetical protein E6Q97_26140 [Desulfurellales bacterium]
MAAHTPGPENVVILVGGTPVSNVNPLPTSGGGGGGGGVVDQGKQGSIAQPWFIQPTADGKTVSLPLPTGAATGAKQDTGNTSLSNIDGKVATETTLASVETLLGAGLPVALSGGRLDVNIGSTGVTQPISGTVTANVGTTGGLALDATLTGGTQRSKVTDGTNNAAVVNTAPSTEYGLVVRNIPSGTQPVSALSLPLPTGAATAAKQPALGTAGTPSADVISVQGVAGGTALSVTATNAYALDATLAKLTISQGAALGTNTQALAGASVVAVSPAYTNGTIQPLAQDTAGNLRVGIQSWFGSTAPSPGQKAMTASLPVVVASDQSAISVTTTATPSSGAPTEKLGTTTNPAAILLASTAAPKYRKIFVPTTSGPLLIRYGSAPTSEATCHFRVEPGQTWEMQPIAPGVLEYSGDVYGFTPTGTATANGVQGS